METLNIEVDQNKSSTFDNSAVESDDEIPDLEFILTPSKKHNLVVNDLVYVKYRNVWWPAVCKNVLPRKKKVSVIYINYEQKFAISVPFSRVKHHSERDSLMLFDQRNEMKGLSEAMFMMESYLSNAAGLNMPSAKFFSLEISEQKQILNELLVEELKAKQKPSENTSPLPIPASPIPVPLPSTPIDDTEPPLKRWKGEPAISEKILSTREKSKLKSAKKARSTMFQPLLQYMRTESCIRHLTKVCKGDIFSKRHDTFLDNIGVNQYWKLHLSGDSAGLNFFSNNGYESSNYINFIFKKFSKKKCTKFCEDERALRMYIILVLLPEAIKQGLRKKNNIRNEAELEEALSKGFRETATEKKARRLFEDLDMEL